jgi:hypothetical protein
MSNLITREQADRLIEEITTRLNPEMATEMDMLMASREYVCLGWIIDAINRCVESKD